MRTTTDIKRVMLKRMTYQVNKMMNPEMIEVKGFIDYHTGDMVAEIRRAIYGVDHQGPIITYPKDWWQAFKEKWFPAILKRRYPVEYRTHNIKFRELYPDFKPSLPDQEVSLKILENE